MNRHGLQNEIERRCDSFPASSPESDKADTFAAALAFRKVHCQMNSDQNDRSKIPSMKELRAEKAAAKTPRKKVEVTALPWVELVIRLTPPQYRILNALSRYEELSPEAMASCIVSDYTDQRGQKTGIGKEDRDYLSDKLGF